MVFIQLKHSEQIKHFKELCAKLVTRRLQVRVLPDTLLGNDLGQVVHTHVPLSPSSIIWYQPHRRERNGSSLYGRGGLPPI